MGTSSCRLEEKTRLEMIPVTRFKALALKELYEAISWYEDQESGLGARFEQEIHSTLLKARKAPNQFPIVKRHVRKPFVAKFPYAIYFTVIEQRLIVIAIYHGSRNPS